MIFCSFIETIVQELYRRILGLIKLNLTYVLDQPPGFKIFPGSKHFFQTDASSSISSKMVVGAIPEQSLKGQYTPDYSK